MTVYLFFGSVYVFIVRWHDHLKYIPDKKRNAYSRFFFYFSELYQIFQLFQLFSYHYQSVYARKNRLIRFKSESVSSLEIREGSKFNVINVSI